MYNAAKALLLTENSSPRTHAGVNSELGKLFRDEIDRDLLREFANVQQKREEADYTNQDFGKDKAQEVYETAEEFLGKANEIVDEKDLSSNSED